MYKIEKCGKWSVWCADASLSELCLANQQELGEKLIEDIQSAYYFGDGPLGQAKQFATFLFDLEKESYYLDWYMRITSFLRAVYFDRISYFSLDFCYSYSKRLDRLDYLKNLFAQYISNSMVVDSSCSNISSDDN